MYLLRWLLYYYAPWQSHKVPGHKLKFFSPRILQCSFLTTFIGGCFFRKILSVSISPDSSSFAYKESQYFLFSVVTVFYNFGRHGVFETSRPFTSQILVFLSFIFVTHNAIHATQKRKKQNRINVKLFFKNSLTSVLTTHLN